MDTKTRYSYQQRIKELEKKNCELSDKLYCYRTTLVEIFEEVSRCVKVDQQVGRGWILDRIRTRCLK